MNKTGKNQHEWGVIAQSFNPYREFTYCPLCKMYREDESAMTKTQFKAETKTLELYEPDSNKRLRD